MNEAPAVRPASTFLVVDERRDIAFGQLTRWNGLGEGHAVDSSQSDEERLTTQSEIRPEPAAT
jgi:hypothetical protein